MSNNILMVKQKFLPVVWHNTVLQCGKKWAWPSKHYLACAACGLLPPRTKNPSYAPEKYSLLQAWQLKDLRMVTMQLAAQENKFHFQLRVKVHKLDFG